jgi:hypothetical protein
VPHRLSAAGIEPRHRDRRRPEGSRVSFGWGFLSRPAALPISPLLLAADLCGVDSASSSVDRSLAKDIRWLRSRRCRVAELRRTEGQIVKSISNLYAQEFTSGMSTQAADRGEPKCGMRSCWWRWLSPSAPSRSHIQASTGREAELVEDRSDAALSGSPVDIGVSPIRRSRRESTQGRRQQAVDALFWDFHCDCIHFLSRHRHVDMGASVPYDRRHIKRPSNDRPEQSPTRRSDLPEKPTLFPAARVPDLLPNTTLRQKTRRKRWNPRGISFKKIQRLPRHGPSLIRQKFALPVGVSRSVHLEDG